MSTTSSLSDGVLLLLQYVSIFYCCSRALRMGLDFTAKLRIIRALQVKQPKLQQARNAYAVVEVSGPWTMEDRTLVYALRNGATLYAVFDGHHGDSAAQFLVDNLGETLERELELEPRNPLHMAHALAAAIKKLDAQYLAQPWLDSGSTCCALVVSNQGRLVTVANTGDSRAILVSQLGHATALSSDHKPNREDERERIAKLGGHISHWGVWRLEGVLAMSRAIGDRALKRFAIPDPEIVQHLVQQNTDRFLVLATDGVWDVLNNHQVARICAQQRDADACAMKIMRQVVKTGLVDNTTVLVVDLTALA